MKAFLLAAGLGTRLRPLTNTIPKCLVPVQGKPLLNHWLETCRQLGIKEVLINTHYMAEAVREWSENQKSGIKIFLSHEEVLRGSAGTVAANRGFVNDEDHFWIFYADNLVAADLKALYSFHARHSGALTLGLFRSPSPKDCGIVTLANSGLITCFEEKPLHPKSDFANAGIYIARRQIFDFLPSNTPSDFGKDIFPALIGKMWGMVLDGEILDVGTPANYEKARRAWPPERALET
jgi:mannose-1-phosphate guanylyltransferase